MSLSLSGKLVLPDGGREYLRGLLNKPNQRAVVSRIINDESRALKVVCEEVSDEDLHRRPDERRSRESLAHGAEYHDSWEIIEARESGADKLQAGVRNTHPFARAVERGTPAHMIRSYGAGELRFPWNGRRTGPHDGGGLGDFLVSGGRNFSGFKVSHPGAGAKRIAARARRRYLDRTRRTLNK